MSLPCPECEKIVKVHAQSQVIGDFLTWLNSKKHYSICQLPDPDVPIYQPIIGIHSTYERLIAEFFDIDIDAAELERRALLAQLRGP